MTIEPDRILLVDNLGCNNIQSVLQHLYYIIGYEFDDDKKRIKSWHVNISNFDKGYF